MPLHDYTMKVDYAQYSVQTPFHLKSCYCLNIAWNKEIFLSQPIFNFALEYAIRRVHAHQKSLILNGTHQLVVNADSVNIMGGSVHTLRKEKHRSYSSR